MTLDYRNPWHPRSRPASAVRCRVCERPFQSGHVPAGDPVCAECVHGATRAHDDAPTLDYSGGDADT